jgi:hypothetical protein
MPNDENEEEEPEDLGEQIEEVIDDQAPPETAMEMGYDEFKERMDAFWDSLVTPVKKKVAEPADKKPEPKPKEPEPKKKETTHARQSKKAADKKDKRRIRLFAR